jgi:hypothetical protein
MDCVKMDDPRLDESFSFLFAFKKGDKVASKADPAVRGEIRDAVYVGEFPKNVAARINRRGKTLYEIALDDESLYIIDQLDLEKI